MLTPVDIQNKTFEVKFRGYNCDEVDDFMDMVIQDYEKMYKENATMKERITVLNEALGNYKNMEDTLQNSIILAQSASEDIRKNANAQADAIIQEAEMKAREMKRKAEEDVAGMKNEYSRLQMEIEGYKARVKGICNGLLEMLDKIE